MNTVTKGVTERPLPVWAQDVLGGGKSTSLEWLGRFLMCICSHTQLTACSIWYPADYPEEPSAELTDLIVGDAGAFLRTWSSLYHNRSRCRLENRDLWAYTRALSGFARDLLVDMELQRTATGHNGEYLASQSWEALLNAGLCSVMHEALSSPDFFDEFAVRSLCSLSCARRA